MYHRNEKRKYKYYEDLQVRITPERKKFFDELIVGKKFKKESIIIKIMEFYVYLACIFIIYKLIKYYH